MWQAEPKLANDVVTHRIYGPASMVPTPKFVMSKVGNHSLENDEIDQC